MDRRKYFDKQLVEPADLDAGETNTYNAIGNLMSDIGIFGIISGGAITEQGSPSMSVDMSGPFIGYDQDGERIYRSTSDVVDCSVDYLSNATVPTTVGEARWISIHGRFDYTLEDSKVIDGNTEYLTWAESYEWRVVSGTAAASPTHTKPAKPADAILITDIELVYGQTTILTADIDDSRRDDFVFATASAISVSAGSWTKLDSAAVTVQDALDSADTELISRNASGYIDQALIPNGGEDIGSTPGRYWGDVFCESVLNDGIGTETLGSTGQPFFGFFDEVEMQGDILANAGTESIGAAGSRFDAHLNTATIYTKLAAAAGGEDLGDATNRFDAFLDSLTHYGALASTMVFSAAKSVTVMIPLHGFIDLSSGWAWNSTKVYINTSTQPETALIKFHAIHGAVLQSMRVRWSQATSTTVQAQIEKCDEDNVATSIGSAKTITTGGGTVAWDIIASTIGETIDLASNYYRVKLTTASNEVHTAYMLEATYDITDILSAALVHA